MLLGITMLLLLMLKLGHTCVAIACLQLVQLRVAEFMVNIRAMQHARLLLFIPLTSVTVKPVQTLQVGAALVNAVLAEADSMVGTSASASADGVVLLELEAPSVWDPYILSGIELPSINIPNPNPNPNPNPKANTKKSNHNPNPTRKANTKIANAHTNTIHQSTFETDSADDSGTRNASADAYKHAELFEHLAAATRLSGHRRIYRFTPRNAATTIVVNEYPATFRLPGVGGDVVPVINGRLHHLDSPISAAGFWIVVEEKN
jgi:hypothetical protein